MTEQNFTQIHSMPFTSGDYEKQPQIIHSDGKLKVKYYYYNSDDIASEASVEFIGVKTYKFVNSRQCEPWQISKAMETLLRIDPLEMSDGSAKDNEQKDPTVDLTSHFIIFISDLGCLDVTSVSASVVESQIS